MLCPPFLENEEQQLEILSDNYLSPVPRDERFDRITRTAMRLLEIPIALVAQSEGARHWLRSVQGLPAQQTGHALDFCGRGILKDRVLLVGDTSVDMQFWENPLVTGPVHVRSYLGIPLHCAGGSGGGTLCAMDTRVDAFCQSDILALQDLARLAEAELRVDQMAGAQKQLLERMGQLERRSQFDNVTGCWNVRRFREMLSANVRQARAAGTSLALCCVRVRNFKELGRAQGAPRLGAVRQVIAQELRQRLPEGGALASLGGSDFCAMVPGPTPTDVEGLLVAFTFPRLSMGAPGIRIDPQLRLEFGLALLHEMRGETGPTEIWATALANLER
ncbi:MAG: GAF domain-containing protein [Ramlibacter sp.]